MLLLHGPTLSGAEREAARILAPCSPSGCTEGPAAGSQEALHIWATAVGVDFPRTTANTQLDAIACLRFLERVTVMGKQALETQLISKALC